MKIFSIIMVVLSTLLVLGWPYCLILTPFLFDAPKGHLNETRIGIFVMIFLSYPLGWIIALGWMLVRRLRRSSKKWWEFPTPYLFLLPFAQLTMTFLMIVFNFMGA